MPVSESVDKPNHANTSLVIDLKAATGMRREENARNRNVPDGLQRGDEHWRGREFQSHEGNREKGRNRKGGKRRCANLFRQARIR